MLISSNESVPLLTTVHEVPYGFAPPWLGQMLKRAWCHLSSLPPFFTFILAVCKTESTSSVGYLA